MEICKQLFDLSELFEHKWQQQIDWCKGTLVITGLGT